jgi:ferrous iron transport protein B
MRESATERVARKTIALVGNPNTGKSTVFNALTGMRQKVSNYPGVTVEKKEGRFVTADGSESIVVDLPGTYSLTPHSPDETVSIDLLLGRRDDAAPPAIAVCVVDASNLERNLYFAGQLIDYGIPVIVALNMMDVARALGITINHRKLSSDLGVQVIPMTASKALGVEELKEALMREPLSTAQPHQLSLPEPVVRECEELASLLRKRGRSPEAAAYREAMELLTSPAALLDRTDRYDPDLIAHVKKDHQKLEFLGIDRESVLVNSRYAWARQIAAGVTERAFAPGMTTSDRIDRIVTHKVWGLLIFLAVMALVFQSIFSWTALPMEWISQGFDRLGHSLAAKLPPGDLRALLIDGALAGVSSVVTFLPQILCLFFFLGILEDTGYMARAAYMMDRMMSRVGLHGKAFIPLLSSFACAIPGIMATRTIDNQKDRLATMLVAPLMSCSARLPVYTLLIGAFIPAVKIFGILSLPAMVLFGLYVFGIVAALAVALLFKKTLLKGSSPGLVIELPPYKMPSLRAILLHMWERCEVFLKNAGTIILAASIVLWFLATYPRLPGGTPAEQLQHSFAGRMGRVIEPVIQPLGFNWKIGIGLVTSLLQREVFVSTMGTIYNIQDDNGEGSISLRAHMQQDRDPVSGAPTFTVLTAVCLMVYYVLAMQCLSTVAVMRRETNGWKWPLFQIGYMSLLAYSVTLLVHSAGVWMGWGG